MKNTAKQEETSTRSLQELPGSTATESVRPPRTSSLDVAPPPSRLHLDRQGVLSLEIKAWEWMQQQPADTRFPIDAPGTGDPLTSPADARSVDKLQGLISREVVSFRHLRADALTVVLRPDAQTEMVLHLNRRNGQVEALIRAEARLLETFHRDWPQLQESLAQMNVRLLPLKDTPPAPPATESQSTGSGGSSELPDREAGHRAPAEARSPEHQAVPGRSGGRRARHHAPETSPPQPAAHAGWESWA